jgi:hypothetical protein
MAPTGSADRRNREVRGAANYCELYVTVQLAFKFIAQQNVGRDEGGEARRENVTLQKVGPRVMRYSLQEEDAGEKALNIGARPASLSLHVLVCQIKLDGLTSSQLEYVTDSEAAMHKPFPELTDLRFGIYEYDGRGPILPYSFLGGSARRLFHFRDYRNYFCLPLTFPVPGYIPPDVMATSLDSLWLHSQQARPRPALESRRPPPPPLTRSIPPTVSPKFDSKGPANIWR